MRTDFMKVRAHLNKGLKYDSHGHFAQSFVNTLYEEDEKFRSAVIVPINEQIGLHNWAIDFIECPGVCFFVDIYADSVDDARKIRRIVEQRVPDIEFEFFHKGTIADYLIE